MHVISKRIYLLDPHQTIFWKQVACVMLDGRGLVNWVKKGTYFASWHFSKSWSPATHCLVRARTTPSKYSLKGQNISHPTHFADPIMVEWASPSKSDMIHGVAKLLTLFAQTKGGPAMGATSMASFLLPTWNIEYSYRNQLGKTYNLGYGALYCMSSDTRSWSSSHSCKGWCQYIWMPADSQVKRHCPERSGGWSWSLPWLFLGCLQCQLSVIIEFVWLMLEACGIKVGVHVCLRHLCMTSLIVGLSMPRRRSRHFV